MSASIVSLLYDAWQPMCSTLTTSVHSCCVAGSHVTAFTEWPYVMIWYSDGFGYAPKQCAAVRMYWSAMRLPPQLCEQ